VDKVYAQIPFPNLWSAPLSLSLDTLTLTFTLNSPTQSSSQKGKSPEQITRTTTIKGKTRSYDLASSVDLAASVTSAADEFLHDELDAFEEAELDRSIRQSLILSRSDPFVQDTVPGAFPSASRDGRHEDGEPLPATVESTTVLAGLVERILARLEFKINTVRIRILHQNKDRDSVVELRIGQIRYADESSQEDTTGATTRTVRISDISIYMLDSPPPASRPAYTPSRSSSTSSASSASDVDRNMEMMMSSAVADLRQSTISEVGSEASVYQSAMSERSAHSAHEHIPTVPESGASTPRGEQDKGVLILSFGNEDVVLRMNTQAPSSTSESLQTANSNSGGRPAPHRAPSSLAGSTMPCVDFDISMGTIAVMLLPRQLAAFLSIAQAISVPGVRADPSPSAPVSEAPQPKMEGRVRIKGIYVSAIYDMAVESTPSFYDSVSTYWTRPSSLCLPVGHLKLKLEGLEATYSTKGYTPRPRSIQSPARPLPRRSSTTSTIRFGPRPPVVTLQISDLSIFEYIATDTTAAADDIGDSIPGGAYPVLLFDAGLAKQYDVLSPGARHTYGPGVNTFPEFDAVDWRSSGLHKKSGGEKAWKVRPKGKGAMKAPAGVEGDMSPVLLLRKELTAISRELNTVVLGETDSQLLLWSHSRSMSS
jgi:autophagy-related protein 2